MQEIVMVIKKPFSSTFCAGMYHYGSAVLYRQVFCKDVINSIVICIFTQLFPLFAPSHPYQRLCNVHYSPFLIFSGFFSCEEMRSFLSVSTLKCLPWALNQSLLTSKVQLLILSLNILFFTAQSSPLSIYHQLKCSTLYIALADWTSIIFSSYFFYPLYK